VAGEDMKSNNTTKRIVIFFAVALVVVFLFVHFFLKQVNPPNIVNSPRSEHIFFGYPSTDCDLLVRTGYVLCYDEKTKVADWASYHMTNEYFAFHVKRSNDFRPDPDVPAGKRSELRDYKRSGYDKGHLVPAQDMSRSEQTMSESFLLTNMAPQTPGLNRGVWKLLEDDVRHWVREKRNVYIIVGPLYLHSKGNRNAVPDTIGPDQVVVPAHFFKIIIAGDPSDPTKLKTIAFIVPNVMNPNKDVSQYLSSIDKIERLSGLDFMNELDKGVQEELESKKPEIWN
jgi:endonuclease G